MGLMDIIPQVLAGLTSQPKQEQQQDPNQAINQMLLQKLGQPNESTQQLQDLYNNYPQDQPTSPMNRIAATIIGATRGPEAALGYLDYPNQKAQGDWKNKLNAAKDIAGLDLSSQKSILANALKEQQVNNVATNNNANRDFKYTKLSQDLDVANRRADTAEQNAKTMQDRAASLAGNYQLVHEANLARIEAQNARAQASDLLHQKQLEEMKRVHDAQIEHLSTENEKLKNPLTTSTRTMMEGAQMLRPHVPEILTMAQDLDRRGLFGPIMSRVRDYAAKVGTTGDPDSVAQSLADFNNGITNDPQLRASNDAVVGKFLAELGLLASGAGRVHGGARGGGSIQMVNYMKGLLSSDSTLSMFKGRLQALDSYLKGYASGPSSETKTPLDLAIDSILSSGGKK